jgi:hypothetical protein
MSPTYAQNLRPTMPCIVDDAAARGGGLSN